MADYNKYGDQTYLWAFEDANAPIIAGIKVTKLSRKFEPEISESAYNDQGLTAAKVVSDQSNYKQMVDVEGYVVDAVDFKNVDNFTFDGRFFIITNKDVTYDHRSFQQGKLSAESYALITS